VFNKLFSSKHHKTMLVQRFYLQEVLNVRGVIEKDEGCLLSVRQRDTKGGGSLACFCLINSSPSNVTQNETNICARLNRKR